MGWLSFIASVLGSVAWPIVALVVLFLVRNELTAALTRLADRAASVKIPGALEVEFNKDFAEARQQSEVIAIQMAITRDDLQLRQPEMNRDEIGFDDPYVAIAKLSPPAAIIEAFKEIELILIEHSFLVTATGEKPSGGLDQIVRELRASGAINSEAAEQFYRVRGLRNIAAHPSEAPELTVGAAMEYRELCKALSAALSLGFARLQVLREGGGRVE
jgi:hypothetical protein